MAVRVLVGLGSNRGASLDIVSRALEDLWEMSVGGFRMSSLWRTSPVDCPPGSREFINAVAAFVTDAPSPEWLLSRLKALEGRYGRSRAPVRNAPRELDLDLLLFGDVVRRTERLTLPHPRALERGFVMTPAAEAAPGWTWPGTGRTIADIARGLTTGETLRRLPQSPGVAAEPAG